MSSQNEINENLLVSVICPTYNRVTGARQLLERLLLQECDFKFEIIFVDDGSPQPIAPQLEDLIGQATILVKCLRKENGGPAAARNFGVDNANGEYLVLIDDDMIIEPNFLQAHIDSQKLTNNGLISSWYDYVIEGEESPFRTWYENQTNEWRRLVKESFTPFGNEIYIPGSPTNLATGSLSMLRSDYLLLGKLDVEYENPAVEDQDFAMKAVKNKMGVYITLRTKAIHKETYNSLKKLCNRQRGGSKDTVRFIKRFALIGSKYNPAIADELGWIDLNKDSSFKVVKKCFRWLITLPVLSSLCFSGIKVLETLMPKSKFLQKCYTVMVSSYAQKGWREGLKFYANVEPLPDWNPNTAL